MLEGIVVGLKVLFVGRDHLVADRKLRLPRGEWLAGESLLADVVIAGDKVQRAQQAAVWCRSGMVWLPKPADTCLWLMDFEDELFNFPQAAFADQVDAFAQLVIYLENFLAEGFRAKRQKT